MSVPAAFDYHAAKSLDEAIALLQQYGDDAKLLAGGHSLLPAMKLRLAPAGTFGRHWQGLRPFLHPPGEWGGGSWRTDDLHHYRAL